jgi:hypothetical protein
MGHLGEARHEVVVVGHEAGNAVERVGHDLHALREGHQQLALVGDFLVGEAHLQLLEALGMQFSSTPSAAATACRVWSSGVLPMPPQEKTTSPAAIVRLKVFGQALPVVAQVFDPGQLQAARAEHLGDLGEVLVLAFAGEDFVADDDGAKGTTHADSPSMVTMAPPRERRRASSP